MKKFLALLLVVCMALCLCACGAKSAPAETKPAAQEAPAEPAAEPAEAEYPTKPITFIIPYDAGDGLDLSCRAMLENIDLPVATVVENISGGAGTIGLSEAFNRGTDGYTVAILSNGPVISQPLLNDTLVYQLDDWQPLTAITAPVLSCLACNTSKGITNSAEMKEFLQSGESFTVGVPNMSGFGYISCLTLFYQMDILDNVTWVSYEGASALYQAYLSGEIDFAAFDDCFAAKYVDAGEDVVVGVVIGAERSQYFPYVECAGEWGIEKVGDNIGFKVAAVPKGTPQYICDYLSEKINEAIMTEGYQSWCEQNYYATFDKPYDIQETTDMLFSVRELNREMMTLAGLL